MSILHTVGHSNRPFETFLTLLDSAEIQVLVDVRRYPMSRRWPHFNRARLEAVLSAAGREYWWVEDLGGRREAVPLERSMNPGVQDPALRGYADWMRSPPFRQALDQLRERGARSRIALMCAERSPEDCHRRYLADYLTGLGDEVIHLGDGDRPRSHVPTAGFRFDAAGQPCYPVTGQQRLPL